MNTGKENTLLRPVKFIKSVGPKRAESFARIGIHTVRDLLFYFPSRYLDRSTIANAAKIYGYVLNGFDREVTVIGQVIDREKRGFGAKEILKVQMRDESGFFECIWFQGARFFQNTFNSGEYYAVSGKPAVSKYGQLQFAHPDFDKITEDESRRFLNTGKIIPFYRVSKELKQTNIGDMSLRRIISTAVEEYAGDVPESLPAELIRKNNLTGIVEALRNVHYPESHEKLKLAYERFKYEELFNIELLVAMRKHNLKDALKGYEMRVITPLVKDFLKTLPFELTRSQLNVLSDIRKDMEKPVPMNRLLQGDVGSGKTIVALIAMLIAKDNGMQSALMVPTEILADQHYKNIKRLLGDLDVKTDILLGGQKKSEKMKVLKRIEEHETDIVIGTHALFEEKVIFSKLGLTVIDEQHRFGVVQRSDLITKGHSPDVLVMTATPIPRTLSMTLYGDLDVSVINEMPKNRLPIITSLRGESRLPGIYDFVIDMSRQGYQTFIIYPLVQESEKLELKAAESHFEELQNGYLSSLKLGMVHGKMSWSEKEAVMEDFASKKYDVLIATTVIEVGIDIPDANIIIINDAHRFGLSQLHQLRGRVGRSNKQAYCILVAKDELLSSRIASDSQLEFMPGELIEKNKAAIRLQTMVRHSNGFDVSETDLKLRGPGDIFGTKQSGFPEFKYAKLEKDFDLLIRAKGDAFEIIDSDPSLTHSSNKLIRDNLILNYKDNLAYARIA